MDITENYADKLDFENLVQKLLCLPENSRLYIYGVVSGFTIAQELENKKETESR